jgi:hypothetical protein
MTAVLVPCPPTGDLDWGLTNWNPGEHPRDRKGRFTGSRTTDLTEHDRERARAVMAGFKPRKFANGAAAEKYMHDNAGNLSEDQKSAVDYYSGDAFLDINRSLRSGGNGGEGYQATIKNLRGGMKPLPDDLILNRTVSLDAFPQGVIEELEGKKVKDAAFSSTALGVTYGFHMGNVQMKIAVPKGTPAIFVGPISRNPHEREILLPDGMEFAVASVKKNDKFGYDVSLIALPKQAGGVDDRVRAAFDPEEVDLSQHQQAYLHALDDLLRKWSAITKGQRAQLAKQIASAINDGHLAKLADLSVDSDHAAAELLDALTRLHNLSAQQAAQEALEQGAVVPVAPPDSSQLGEIAVATAALLAAGMAVNAGREALRRRSDDKTGEQVAREVADWLDEQSDRSIRVAVGGALTGTQNRARIETWAKGPVGSFYAVEKLDNKTCENCRLINGRFITTTEDMGPLDRMYTQFGGYVDCLGGAQCRGTVTGVWRPKTVQSHPEDV